MHRPQCVRTSPISERWPQHRWRLPQIALAAVAIWLRIGAHRPASAVLASRGDANPAGNEGLLGRTRRGKTAALVRKASIVGPSRHSSKPPHPAAVVSCCDWPMRLAADSSPTHRPAAPTAANACSGTGWPHAWLRARPTSENVRNTGRFEQLFAVAAVVLVIDDPDQVATGIHGLASEHQASLALESHLVPIAITAKEKK